MQSASLITLASAATAADKKMKRALSCTMAMAVVVCVDEK